ncbi:MAG: hypothetical protein A3F18_05080 [Legionellales bacterium RIFCSPHIGHO2_12_FULL_37_14]|nr:MAG: hypothetical protein A3F18_05080 [Legionellales bacterium RIFCSPHIGHO2_12_FULL_37_14]
MWINKHAKLVILAWLIAFIASLPFIPKILTPFQSTGFVAEGSESAITDDFLQKKLPYYTNRFIALYHSNTLRANEDLYLDKIKQSLRGLRHFSLEHKIIYPDKNNGQISKDNHAAYALILIKDNDSISDELLNRMQHLIKTPKNMNMYLGGKALFLQNVNEQTQTDLHKADIIAAPASIITLILVFGTLVAALLPIVLGGGAAVIILVILFAFGNLFSLSIFTLNIALLLGLCLSLDYSLFIVYRFREELRQHNVANAIAISLSTAGRSVFFSGLAVLASLSALLFFSINILFSMSIGGLVAVIISVAAALTILPAVLSILNYRINFLPIGFFNPKNKNSVSSQAWMIWHKIAYVVVKRPLLFFFTVIVILLFLGYPLLHVRLGVADTRILPQQSSSYQFFNEYRHKFNENELSPIFLVVRSKKHDILSPSSIKKLYHFTKSLKKNHLIKSVESIVTTTPQLYLAQYQTLYSMSRSSLTKDMQQLLDVTTADKFTVITVVSLYDNDSPKTKALVAQLRKMHPPKGLTVSLTGEPVNNIDVLHSISHAFLYAVIWIMLLTYFILLFLLRSLFLPFKAIIVNMLSLCVSYGLLVFVFQDGHLQNFLDFNVQPSLDISLLVIIFCALFGFSMDYEVFLLTRIKECFELGHNNKKSIIFGIEKSCRIITSAALIVIVLCGSFMSADVLMVKEFGLGIAVAIFVDAFIIRSLLVPAIMVLLRDWNWYLPMWMKKIL